jgi:ribonuclease-3
MANLCKDLRVSFADLALFQQALTHSSYANERKNDNVQHNERLEFLGDAVLDLIVSEYLFRNFSGLPEGDLTKARAAIVCEQTLSRLAREIGIGNYLLLGKGEAASGGRERTSILADAFEAVIGSIYIDCGLEVARQVVESRLVEEFALIKRGDYANDYKTLLQERVQRSGDNKICYDVISTSGPDHSKTFEVVVSVNSQKLGMGSGKNKKEAEQNAAQQALLNIGPIED